jgi:hypothetical protein
MNLLFDKVEEVYSDKGAAPGLLGRLKEVYHYTKDATVFRKKFLL